MLLLSLRLFETQIEEACKQGKLQFGCQTTPAATRCAHPRLRGWSIPQCLKGCVHNGVPPTHLRWSLTWYRDLRWPFFHRATRNNWRGPPQNRCVSCLCKVKNGCARLRNSTNG